MKLSILPFALALMTSGAAGAATIDFDSVASGQLPDFSGLGVSGAGFVALDAYSHVVAIPSGGNYGQIASTASLTFDTTASDFSFKYAGLTGNGYFNGLDVVLKGASGNTLASLSVAPVTTYTAIQTFAFAGVSGIKTVEFTSITSPLGTGLSPVDDISFTLAPVPEPGEWAMMAAGLMITGAAARRAKRKAQS